MLFKKGYLSRPKRLEEGGGAAAYLGPPLISQLQLPQGAALNGDSSAVVGIGDEGSDGGSINTTPTDVDPALLTSEDNSPLYFCPGFVDHNGYFHANRK